MKLLRVDGTCFRDGEGRRAMLRGVNLSGSSKVPRLPEGATHRLQGFFAHRKVSFVGRLFPLVEADEHLSRLRAWGFNFLRLLITWEAIEHAGPGRYDHEYLEYLEAVVRRAGDYGFFVLIDPHQDVWSRFSGVDGAPGWTLEAVGFELRNLHATGAAFLHAMHGDPAPHLIWPTNATKLAAATIAPRTRIDGESAQAYLQRHYIAAIQQAALRLKRLDHVIGYGTMNEPWPGYIGWEDLTEPHAVPFLGEVPSPLQSMLLGSGIAQDVGQYTVGLFGTRLLGKRRVDPGGLRAWQRGRECVWRENGVWDIHESGQPVLLRPRHFAPAATRPLDFANEFSKPFARRFLREIRKADPEAYIFLDAEPLAEPPHWRAADGAGVVFAPHWYDGMVMFTKDCRSWIATEGSSNRLVLGARRIRRAFADHIRRLQRSACQRLGPTPVVIGEFGIPFDLQRGRAFKTGDFSLQARALDRSFRAMEDALAHCALWNYTPDNDNIHGDQWNGEDFSIFSRDQQKDRTCLDSGGRALEAVVRPYARAVAGELLEMCYDCCQRVFRLAFRHEPGATSPTEINLPALHYGEGCQVSVSDGSFERRAADQLLVYHGDPAHASHEVVIRP